MCALRLPVVVYFAKEIWNNVKTSFVYTHQWRISLTMKAGTPTHINSSTLWAQKNA